MRKTLHLDWNLKDTLDYISQAKDRIFVRLCNKFLFFSKQMCTQRIGGENRVHGPRECGAKGNDAMGRYKLAHYRPLGLFQLR
jgi:hypothetical protein